MLYYNILVEL